MSESIAINYPAFNYKVKANKKETIKVIQEKAEESKLGLLKSALKENDITYDDNIKDYPEFIKYIQTSLKGKDLSIANEIIKNINQEIDKMINELKNGSTTAFSNFINSGYKNVISPLGNAVTNSLAANALITLTPTAIGKAGVGIVLTGISLHNLSKINKYKLVTNKTYELNRILGELELTKDKNGNVTDTRFNASIQEYIKEFLRSNDINYEDTGYLSLRDAIYNLDGDKKEELCRIINNLKGNLINIDDRIQDFNNGLFKRLKNKYFKSITVGATTGVGIATAINSIEPGIIASPVNGTFLGKILENLSESKVVSWIGGIAGGALSTFGKYIPIVGSSIEKFLAMENIALSFIAGAGIGLITSIGKNIYRALKNKINLFNTQKNAKKLQELDFKLYGNADIEEINIISEKLKNQKQNGEEFIINIVCQYMDELNIEYGKRPRSFKDLHDIVGKLEKKEKKQVNDLLCSLEEYFHREPNKFKRGMKKIGNYIKTVVTVGLASLSVFDILSAGEFLANLKSKVFKDSGYKIPDRIPEYNDNVGIEAYDKTNLRPTPGPAPAPTPTPTPTPSPTVPSNTMSISTPTSSGIDINSLIMNPNENSELISQLSELTDKELYKVFESSNNPSHAERGLKLLTTKDFSRLRNYAETSSEIEREMNTGYRFLREGFRRVINEQNNNIEKTIEEINKNILKEKQVDKLTKTIKIPVTFYNSIEEKNVTSQK